jgi:hypothetical protein
MIDEKQDFIRVYERALPAQQAQQVCGHLAQLFARGFGVSRKDAGQGPKTLRDDLQIFEVRDVDASDSAVKEVVLPVLQACLVKYVDEFDILQNATLAGWQLKAQLTRKGEGYHDWHFEASSFFYARRVLAWTIYLNDDYAGGELEFLYFAKRIKPRAGDVVIFPATFTHAHRGNMVLDGDKLILTGWYELVPDER